MDIDWWWDREKNAASPGPCGMGHDADWWVKWIPFSGQLGMLY
jgi:hypothetical protein